MLNIIYGEVEKAVYNTSIFSKILGSQYDRAVAVGDSRCP